MPYSSSFVTKPRPVLSSDNSASLSSQSRKAQVHYSSRLDARTSRQAASTVSAYHCSPIDVSPSARALPEHGYRGQTYGVIADNYHPVDDQGEDSDCFNESTPGRAWKKCDHAHPRMRVLGFDTSTQYTSGSGGNDPSSRSRSRQNPNDGASVPYNSSRQGIVPEKADFLHRQNLELSSGKSRISHASASPITQQQHVDGSKRTPPRSADVYRENYGQGRLGGF